MSSRSSIFLICAAFAVMFAMLYFADQFDSAIPMIPRLSESEVRGLLIDSLNQSNGSEVIFAIDHPQASDRHFPLLFHSSNGTLFRINNTDFSVIAQCVPSFDEACTVEDPMTLSEIKGRLAYFVEISLAVNPNGSSWQKYFVDANNGKILYSS